MLSQRDKDEKHTLKSVAVPDFSVLPDEASPGLEEATAGYANREWMLNTGCRGDGSGASRCQDLLQLPLQPLSPCLHRFANRMSWFLKLLARLIVF